LSKEGHQLFCIPEFAPPLEEKNILRPWLLLKAQPLKHRQSDSGSTETSNIARQKIAYAGHMLRKQPDQCCVNVGRQSTRPTMNEMD